MMNNRSAQTNAPQYETAEPIRLAIDPGTAPSEELAKVFRCLSDLNVAFGGCGLTFEVTEETVAGMPIVEARPITYGPIDQPPNSFVKE